MNTSQSQVQIRQAAAAFKNGFKALSTFFPTCNVSQLEMIAGVLEDDVEAAKPVKGNVGRTAVATKTAKTAPDFKKGTVLHSITEVLAASKNPMDAEAITEALRKKNLLPPRAKNPKSAVAHALAVSTGDHIVRAGRGLYTLGSSPKAVETKKASTEPKTNHTAAIIEVLKKAKQPITIPDIAKAANLGSAYRSANTFLMTLGRMNIVTKLAEKTAGKKTLYSVDQKALAKYLQSQQS